jgi:hypothetical protein
METALPLTEKQFMAQIIELARLKNWLVYHVFDSRRSESGWPDIVLCKDRVIFVEVKTQKGRLSPAQKSWLDALEKAGAECYVWRPADWPAIEKLLMGD